MPHKTLRKSQKRLGGISRAQRINLGMQAFRRARQETNKFEMANAGKPKSQEVWLEICQHVLTRSSNTVHSGSGHYMANDVLTLAKAHFWIILIHRARKCVRQLIDTVDTGLRSRTRPEWHHAFMYFLLLFSRCQLRFEFYTHFYLRALRSYLELGRLGKGYSSASSAWGQRLCLIQTYAV